MNEILVSDCCLPQPFPSCKGREGSAEKQVVTVPRIAKAATITIGCKTVVKNSDCSADATAWRFADEISRAIRARHDEEGCNMVLSDCLPIALCLGDVL